MRINFPKKQYTINIMTKHAEYLEKVAEEKQMPIDGVIMQALTWYQIVNDTPGARDAVNALRPQLSPKQAMMPTEEDYKNLIEAMERESK